MNSVRRKTRFSIDCTECGRPSGMWNHALAIKLGSVYICDICGYTVEGEAPNRCPVCGAAKEKFRKF